MSPSSPVVPLLPKVELHLHLDCNISFGAARALRPSLTMAEYRRDFVAPGKCPSLTEWLPRAINIVALAQSPAALKLMTADVFDQLVRDEVVYAEIRFAPLLHVDGGMAPEEVIGVVEDAVTECSAATGVAARLIICTVRHFSREQSLESARLAADAVQRGLVVGFDIAGDEALFPLDPHLEAFALARSAGLGITAHAGESLGPESVWETLEKVAPTRIGHGVRSVEDPALVRQLVDAGTHLEVCPTSNVQTMGTVIPTYRDHPVDALKSEGVSLSISTDARTIAAVTLTQEYQRLSATFGWSLADFRACNEAALSAAFVDAATKQKLLDRLASAETPAR